MEISNPLKLTDDVRQKLEYAFSLDATVDEACFLAEISKQTYYNWIASFPELKERFDALRQSPVLAARSTVVAGIKNDPELALKYLERKRKDEFSPRVESTGKDGKDLPTPILTINNNVPNNDSHEESNGNDQENQGDMRGDERVEDGVDSALLDTLSTV
jgi:hypothetical protein